MFSNVGLIVHAPVDGEAKERGRCADGWLTLTSKSVKLVRIEKPVRPGGGAASGVGKRRMSVATDGVGEVASLAGAFEDNP